ncbi:hypothetical protein [Segetibacter koreensis]|uniref:hypothetical protein n=1 Tax=Segetibacter koreensis TaxID=398037 RepID=UPI00037AF5CD|nr:hypothetical protein [Segetibacter koreensis]
MKKILLSAAILLALNVNAQKVKDDHLFIQAGTGMQDNMIRLISDIGVQIRNTHRFTLYAETFQTERYKKDGLGYRKFFLGTRYSYIINLSERFAVIPNMGIDVRLSGSQMISVRPQIAMQGSIAKRVSLFTSAGYQIYNTGLRKYNPRSRVEAGVNICF